MRNSKSQLKPGYYRLKPEYKDKWFANSMNTHIYRNCNRFGDVFVIENIIAGEGYSRKMKVISDREIGMFQEISALEEYEMKHNITFDNLTLCQDEFGKKVLKRIVAAAIKFPDDFIICSPRLRDSVMVNNIARLGLSDQVLQAKLGYIDQFGNFYSPVEAMAIVWCNGQSFDVKLNDNQTSVLYDRALW